MRLPNLSAGVMRANFAGTDAAADSVRGVEPSACNNVQDCTSDSQCGTGCKCQSGSCVLKQG
jgi:hypothetical protein